jgi:hypothetical protein
MAIGTITVQTNQNLKASAPVKYYILQFDGEDTYVKGTGTALFEAMVQAAVGEGVTLMGVVTTLSDTNPEYLPVYDEQADALKILDPGAGDEAATADYSGTAFNFLAICI